MPPKTKNSFCLTKKYHIWWFNFRKACSTIKTKKTPTRVSFLLIHF